MVPYDQPEAALVRRHCAPEYVKMLTSLTCLGYDYPMGQEYSSGELIRCIVSHVPNPMDTNDNIRVSGTFPNFRTFLMPQRGFDGSALTRFRGLGHTPSLDSSKALCGLSVIGVFLVA